MTIKSKISDLFQEEPFTWGLRGDVYLWREMQERLQGKEIPENKNELKEILETTYQEATGHAIGYTEIFRVGRFRHGGMSSGAISQIFWVNKGIPLLLSRAYSN